MNATTDNEYKTQQPILVEGGQGEDKDPDCCTPPPIDPPDKI